MRVNNLFNGSLNGVSFHDVMTEISQLDRGKLELDYRKEQVEDIIESGFFDKYNEDVLNVHISQDSKLSNENNVSQLLEGMGTYLLTSDVSRKMDKDSQTKIVFVQDDNLDKNQISKMTDHRSVDEISDPLIQFARKPKKTNQYKDNNVRFEKSDVEKYAGTELGDILKQYNEMYDYVEELFLTGQISRYKANKYKFTIVEDMILSKTQLLGVWRLNVEKHMDSPRGFDFFDFTDYKTVKYVLTGLPTDHYENGRIDDTVKDFDMLCKRVRNDLTERQQIVLDSLRKGLTVSDIQELSNGVIDRFKTTRTDIPIIVKAIIALGEKYDAEDEELAQKINYFKEKNIEK